MPSLKEPSRNDVELALKALEIEDEREKEVIRNFYRRERNYAPPHLYLRSFVIFMGVVGLLLLGCWLALQAIAEKVGI